MGSSDTFCSNALKGIWSTCLNTIVEVLHFQFDFLQNTEMLGEDHTRYLNLYFGLYWN